MVFGYGLIQELHYYKSFIMVTQLRFNHKGQQVIARLIFNFKEVKDMIMIVPAAYSEEIGEEILFDQDESAAWVTDAPFSKRFPSTFDSLAAKLSAFFKTCGFSFYKTPVVQLPA
jgi:hypothetical protein